MTLPPYPSPSDLERDALAEERRQAALADSPRARRNKAAIALIVIVFMTGLLLCGLVTGYRVAGWPGLVVFAALWIAPSAAMLAWALHD